MDSPQDTPLSDAAPAASRWFQRVVPVTGLLVALVVVGSLLSPAVRDEVGLSLSRQDQSYVELYFARTPESAAQAVCTRKGASVRVRFVVASHLEERQDVAYRVAVNPTTKGLRTQRKAGAAKVTPGAAVEVVQRFALPRTEGYTASVTLPASEQQLRAHCRGQRR
ncbi:MAG: hypothetical protein ABWY19_05625 [Marmoricola sp.]